MSHRRLSDIVVDDQIGAEAAGATINGQATTDRNTDNTRDIDISWGRSAETIGRSSTAPADAVGPATNAAGTQRHQPWPGLACTNNRHVGGDRSDSAARMSFRPPTKGSQMLRSRSKGRRYQRPADQ